MAPRAYQTAPKPPFGLTYHYESGMGRYRVWNDSWIGDQFEILTYEEFRALQSICAKFGIPLVEQDDES